MLVIWSVSNTGRRPGTFVGRAGQYWLAPIRNCADLSILYDTVAPSSNSAADVSDTPAAGIVPVSGPPAVRVLVVDDDGAICVAYDEVLRAHQYEVSTAGSRAEALREIARLNGGVDVLILDIALPDADGADLAREITGQIGQRPTLYVSGWTDEFWDLTAAPGRWLVLQKPIPIPRLIEAVDWLSGRRAARPDGA